MKFYPYKKKGGRGTSFHHLKKRKKGGGGGARKVLDLRFSLFFLFTPPPPPPPHTHTSGPLSATDVLPDLWPFSYHMENQSESIPDFRLTTWICRLADSICRLTCSICRLTVCICRITAWIWPLITHSICVSGKWFEVVQCGPVCIILTSLKGYANISPTPPHPHSFRNHPLIYFAKLYDTFAFEHLLGMGKLYSIKEGNCDSVPPIAGREGVWIGGLLGE